MTKQTTILVLVLVGAVLLGGFYFLTDFSLGDEENNSTRGSSEEQTSDTNNNEGGVEDPRTEMIAEGLRMPWGLAFLPSGDLLVTERGGSLLRLDVQTGESQEIATLPRTQETGEGGLLGLALHPNFSENNKLYVYQTTDIQGGTTNRVVAYEFENNDLSGPQTIIDGIPGAPYHDGGRIAFGPEGFLYVTVGDATEPDNAPDISTLTGKILRLNPDGSTPADNPFGNAVYSYGHRNPQGLAWDESGRLWSTEHGRSGIRSGFDEINLIKKGNNYGWPDFEGDESGEGITEPVRHSTAEVTWAPASAAYLNGSLYFGGLRGRTLYEAVLEGRDVVEIKEHLVEEYGRIRTVAVGPQEMLYLTTSNRDGRGEPIESDDRIIRVDPEQL